MKTVIPLVALCVACHATADVQKIPYIYDDSVAKYSLVSFTESGSAIQAIVKREGAYFNSYTKVELDCANRSVRQMGMYNSLEVLEKAQLDQMQGRIVEGSIADEVGKILCKGTTLTASQPDNPPVEEQPDDRT
ncbi:hypothetical protein [Pseudomonas corrugata]|uniref:hypothetical protein n=1 Tax=Pseudomonas corrugata TaxID=47879 RepID=UPI001586C610|nr:hypothetical protein [Pseudomonas corrugata]MCI0998010.1 hypothetical protein [Pseudomonas corrugata]NUT66445.1 hypothetical protein [Pseudomonas corrugata]